MKNQISTLMLTALLCLIGAGDGCTGTSGDPVEAVDAGPSGDGDGDPGDGDGDGDPGDGDGDGDHPFVCPAEQPSGQCDAPDEVCTYGENVCDCIDDSDETGIRWFCQNAICLGVDLLNADGSPCGDVGVECRDFYLELPTCLCDGTGSWCCSPGC